MGFKELIAEDTRKVFMNFDEFGEMHTVDGKDMLVIVDGNEHIERKKRRETRAEGLYVKELLFYVSKETYGALPAIGRMCRFDKKDYLVSDAIDENGIYSISLEAVRS